MSRIIPTHLWARLVALTIVLLLVPSAVGSAASYISESYTPAGEVEVGDVVWYARGFGEDGPALTSFTVQFEHADGAVVERHDPSPANDRGTASWLVRPGVPRGTWTMTAYEATFADGSREDGVPNGGKGVAYTIVDEAEEGEQGGVVVPRPICRTWDRFRDVCTDSPHRFDVYDLSLAEITSGCAEDYFCPHDPVSRGQMAAFLARALDLPRPRTVTFVDTSESVFVRDIEAIAAAGITYGCNPPRNDRYCPDEPVSRAQMAGFLVRALELTGGQADEFEDVPSDHTFHGDIAALAAAGITTGCNPPRNDRYCPSESVTRAQMATFLYRAGVVV